jgi:lipoprotein-anchoring transpeptidase ErfK/SrfK
MRKILSATATLALAMAMALPAQAANGKCSNFLVCLFGVRHRAEPTTPLVTPGPNGDDVVLTGASRRQTVSWDDSKYKPGTIIIRTPERALYYVLPNGEALKYAVGVGREGFQWSGSSTIVSKAEWPGWTPPQVMIEREAKKGHFIPAHMDGGPANPLGARAMYLGGRMYRIHGTNNEASIGGAVSSGCIRMMNADVIDLYSRVKVGARVYVYQ